MTIPIQYAQMDFRDHTISSIPLNYDITGQERDNGRMRLYARQFKHAKPVKVSKKIKKWVFGKYIFLDPVVGWKRGHWSGNGSLQK